MLHVCQPAFEPFLAKELNLPALSKGPGWVRTAERGNDGAGATGIPELDAMRPETALGAAAVLLRDAVAACAQSTQTLDGVAAGAVAQLEAARLEATRACADATLASRQEISGRISRPAGSHE